MTFGCSGGGRLRLGEAWEAAERRRSLSWSLCVLFFFVVGALESEFDNRVSFVSIKTKNRTIVQRVLRLCSQNRKKHFRLSFQSPFSFLFCANLYSKRFKRCRLSSVVCRPRRRRRRPSSVPIEFPRK